jgi:micrococcal nuclease
MCTRLKGRKGAPSRAPSPETILRRGPATAVRVVDGDTLEVRVGGRVERVQMIGLDAPESVDPCRPVECFGREASAKARELLPAGTAVQLGGDPRLGDRDRYGRLLRYVILPDGRNVAELMLAEGCGFEFTCRLPHRYQEQFRATQRAAGEAGRGPPRARIRTPSGTRSGRTSSTGRPTSGRSRRRWAI